MNLKKWKLISVIGIFVLSGIFHFGYQFCPSFGTSLIFPINESIWEHNKIIILAFFIWSLIEKLYYKNKKNTLYAGFLSGIFCSFLVINIFTPIYFLVLKNHDNMFVTLLIFFIATIISEIINYKMLIKEPNKKLEIIALLGFILIFIVNGILTYHPLNLPIFHDYSI